MTEPRVATSVSGLLLVLMSVVTPIYSEKWKIQVQTLAFPHRHCPVCWHYLESSGKCYRHVDASLSYTSAKKGCYGRAKLVTSATSQINEKIRTIITGRGWPWIGLEKSSEDNKFKWANGDTLSWKNWGSGVNTDAVKCVTMSPDSGKWASADCNNERGYICEQDPISNLCENWRQFRSSDKCYLRIYQTTVLGAKRNCGLYRCGALAMSPNSQINEEIRKYLYPGWAWIGLEKSSGNEFKWSNGDNLSWANWDSGIQLDKVKCVVISAGTGKWGSADCDSIRPFVCEKKTTKLNHVYITLKGTHSEKAPEQELGNILTDLSTFTLDIPYIGILDSIQLRYGGLDGWKLGWITVENMDTRRAVYTFEHFDFVPTNKPLSLEKNDFTNCGTFYTGWTCEFKCHCKEGCDECKGCDAGWTGFQCLEAVHHDISYKILTKAVNTTIRKARKMCSDYYGAELPEPKFEQDNKNLANLGLKHRMPLGISDEKEDGKWLYDSDGMDVSYFSWLLWSGKGATPEPDGQKGEGCAAMINFDYGEVRRPGYRRDGWFDMSCWNELTFAVVCAKDCPPNKFGDGCTKECHCNGAAEDCNMFTGVCAKGCAGAWTGPSCQTEECFRENGIAYMGHASQTRSGRTCQRWSVKTPHTHDLAKDRFPDGDYPGNFCRKVKNAPGEIWCYTTDPGVENDECDVPRCHEFGIEYETDVKIERACPGRSLAIQCEKGETLQIETANFGRLSTEFCTGGHVAVTNCINRVTTQIRNVCQFKRKCQEKASTDMFFDKCPGTDKYLEVQYRCVRREWIQQGNHFYKIFKYKTSYAKAKTLCEDHGGMLPEPQNAQENNDLENLSSEKFYLGTVKVGGKWTWQTSQSPVSWANWVPDPIADTCAVMLKPHAKWDQISCDEIPGPADVVCQKCVKTVHVCNDGDNLDIACENEELVISVISAFHGRKSLTLCDGASFAKVEICNKGLSDITEEIRRRCNEEHACKTKLTYTDLGDPCPGYNKYYEVTYVCVPESQEEQEDGLQQASADADQPQSAISLPQMLMSTVVMYTATAVTPYSH